MIKQLVPSEFCLKCRECCKFAEADSVWAPCLMDEEVQDLLDKKIPPASISAGRRIIAVFNPSQDNFVCPFLGLEENKCKIYEFRPFECQIYPFLITLRGKKVILTVDLNCPFVKENLNTKEFKEYTAYLVSVLNSPSRIKALKDNPHVLQAYQDVLDIIELKSVNEAK